MRELTLLLALVVLPVFIAGFYSGYVLADCIVKKHCQDWHVPKPPGNADVADSDHIVLQDSRSFDERWNPALPKSGEKK